MRHVLIDHARSRAREKRGGALQRVSLEGLAALAEGGEAELLALDEALARLEEFDRQKARVVELRYFVGLDIEKTAEVLGVSPRTVRREWRRAKAWLHYPYTSDFTAWYAGATIFALSFTAALAVYGFRTLLAGRPLLRDGALGD